MSDTPRTVDLERVKIDPAWALRIPVSLAARRWVMPFAAMEGQIYVACLDPADTASMEAVQRYTGQKPVPIIVDREALRRAIARVYGEDRKRVSQPVLRAELAALTPDDAVALADEIILAAILRQASDIHLDPERDALRVRLRVDGVLEDYHRLPLSIHAALCSRIKVLAGMDIAERRAPQDGAFSYRFGVPDGRQAIDIRVASLPIRNGERLTLRLLAAQDERLSLSQLGMSPEDLVIVERILAQPHGLMLLTGPTGSGKTTTLYATIQRLRESMPLNILTVEDPIEYEMSGVGQAEVDSADKVSFQKALRSLLRHDPDIVMIGEIRDADSLDIAIKASLTGHLVLSTLHTNNATSVVTRLADMGVQPHLIGATLRLSVAQRLVRRLCPECRQPEALSHAEAIAMGRPAIAGQKVYRHRGCLYCAGRGFAGRVGLFECMAPDPEIAGLIAGGCTEAQLLAALRAKGFRSLMDDAVAKVLGGVSTVAEVLEVAAEY
jgi:general secretion pathway protein E